MPGIARRTTIPERRRRRGAGVIRATLAVVGAFLERSPMRRHDSHGRSHHIITDSIRGTRIFQQQKHLFHSRKWMPSGLTLISRPRMFVRLDHQHPRDCRQPPIGAGKARAKSETSSTSSFVLLQSCPTSTTAGDRRTKEIPFFVCQPVRDRSGCCGVLGGVSCFRLRVCCAKRKTGRV